MIMSSVEHRAVERRASSVRASSIERSSVEHRAFQPRASRVPATSVDPRAFQPRASMSAHMRHGPALKPLKCADYATLRVVYYNY
jgi:hypothetical protein